RFPRQLLDLLVRFRDALTTHVPLLAWAARRDDQTSTASVLAYHCETGVTRPVLTKAPVSPARRASPRGSPRGAPARPAPPPDCPLRPARSPGPAAGRRRAGPDPLRPPAWDAARARSGA